MQTLKVCGVEMMTPKGEGKGRDEPPEGEEEEGREGEGREGEEASETNKMSSR